MVQYVWLNQCIAQLAAADIGAINGLLKLLSPNSPQLTADDLARISEIRGMHLVLARDSASGDRVVGMARLIAVPMLVGHEGIIEDVAVEPAYGGRGIGKDLMQQLIARGREVGLVRVVLTTWPDREPANRLYHSLGFEQLGVNYYRLRL